MHSSWVVLALVATGCHVSMTETGRVDESPPQADSDSDEAPRADVPCGGVPGPQYRDGDGDGVGAGVPVFRCGLLTGYAWTGGDCDDSDPAISPRLSENCATTYDDNCDGSTNAEDWGTVWYADGCRKFYRDEDEDGWGVTDSECLCDGLGLYTAQQAGDCDDSDAEVTGDSPTCRDVTAITVGEIHGVIDALQPGFLWMASGALGPDGETAIVAGDYTSDVPGVLYVAPVRMGASTLDDPSVITYTATKDGPTDILGWWEAALDANGDGQQDLAFEADGIAPSATTHVILGPLPAQSGALEDLIWGSWTSPDVGEGLSPTLIHDSDGDGTPEILFEASFSNRAYLVEEFSAGEHSVHDVDTEFSGGKGFPYGSADGGDLDGDGLHDIVIATDGGNAYAYFGPLSGMLATSEADASLSSALGTTILAGGYDADGDGADDLLIGFPYVAADAGRLFVVPGPLSGSATLADVASLRMDGRPDWGVGSALAYIAGPAGTSIATGAPFADVGHDIGGAVLVLPGDAAGTVAPGAKDEVLVYGATSCCLGASLVSVPDVDGDGSEDLVASSSQDNAGVIFLLSGAGLPGAGY